MMPTTINGSSSSLVVQQSYSNGIDDQVNNQVWLGKSKSGATSFVDDEVQVCSPSHKPEIDNQVRFMFFLSSLPYPRFQN
ncbi:hypothetical protein L1987_13015 [Smallanthus sonchifolius]|uniref:Uncharacterized protein n=1 Tax=Smallanthus sonchifolius TaxID=185202 RepID=A0ACB9JHG5_9ASTR|nr:hypothetical protein L1987_13015 [Smallanthus sonchifolius]